VTRFGAVLCDLDGVLRRWDPDGMAALDRAAGLPAGTFAATAFAPHRLTPAITGGHSDEQWRAAVATDLAARCGARRAAELVATWSAGAGAVDEEVAALLDAVDVPVVVVTNATTRLETDLAALGLAGRYAGVVNSARIGVAKPDPRIYAAAAEVAGVAVERCLFVDDTAVNVEAARELGMATVRFRDAGQLRTALGTPDMP
jgi:putative hydrolase of the HAD superfamily